MNPTTYAVAPEPPAGPGERWSSLDMQQYLQEMGRWRGRRERELRVLDEFAATAGAQEETTEDMTLSMTLWHAAAQRHDLLLAAGEDAGPEPGAEHLGRFGRLVWSVIEQPGADHPSLALSLPQACRLSDALASSLRSQLQVDDQRVVLADRLEALRLQLRRIRELVQEQPEEQRRAARDRLAELQAELADLTERVGSHPDGAVDQGEERSQVVDAGHTVVPGETEPRPAASTAREEDRPGSEEPTDTADGPADLPDLRPAVGHLESAAAVLERDLIVQAARSRHEQAQPDHVREVREELVIKASAVRSLAERAVQTLHPAPRLAIPDVTALGEVPDGRDELATYVSNLERVDRALEQAHATYAAALAHYSDLLDRVDTLASTLSGTGAPTSVDLAGMLSRAIESLDNVPADLVRAAALISAQEAYLAEMRTDR